MSLFGWCGPNSTKESHAKCPKEITMGWWDRKDKWIPKETDICDCKCHTGVKPKPTTRRRRKAKAKT